MLFHELLLRYLQTYITERLGNIDLWRFWLVFPNSAPPSEYFDVFPFETSRIERSLRFQNRIRFASIAERNIL